MMSGDVDDREVDRIANRANIRDMRAGERRESGAQELALEIVAANDIVDAADGRKGPSQDDRDRRAGPRAPSQTYRRCGLCEM